MGGRRIPTLAGLAPEELARLEARIAALRGGAPDGDGIPRRRDDGPAPLSFAQQRIWMQDQLDPGARLFSVPVALRLRGELDAAALRRTLDEIVRRHEVFRTTFELRADGPVQVVHPARGAGTGEVDVSGRPDAAEEALRLAAAAASRPFDLARETLFRPLLVRAGAREHVLVMPMHHIVQDRWSSGVLLDELAALYRAYARGEASPLPEPALQYADFAAWQRERLRGEALDRLLAFWKRRLEGAPESLGLPADFPPGRSGSFRAGQHPVRIPEATVRTLRALAREEGGTLYMAFLAAYVLFLRRYAGQDDLVVGSNVGGRTRTETKRMMGSFANTLALRFRASGARTFREHFREVRETVIEAHRHQELPFDRLVEELQPAREPGRMPLIRASLDLHRAPGAGLELPGLEAETVPVPAGAPGVDLHWFLEEGDGGVLGVLEYDARLFLPATAARLADAYLRLLDATAADPGAPLDTLDPLPPAERARVLEEWNDTRRDYPGGCVHDLFAAQAARTPDAPALSFRGQLLTYAELDRRSARLANRLRERGVGPETRVGVCLERAPELVVALLAVLRAGGAYVPLDPAYPRERLGWMLEDAAVSLVLTVPALADRLPAGVERVAPDAAGSDEAPRSGVGPENLSHVIFTSGSTGRPKGVMIRHSSTVVLLHWLRENVSDEERSSVLFSTSVNFDVSVAEVFGTLCWGGKLVLVENALELASVEEPLAYASMVPTAAAELLRTGGIPASVRTLNLGGEPLPADLARALHELGTLERVGNLYGPTEDTTYSTYSLVERGAATVRVGRPVANTRAYVLDGALRPSPVGTVGELYLAGGGLARGYAGRPDLTAERFLPDPFGAPGTRMYRVMDRVRWTAGGELEYFGRTDFQVKVRGFRIELGEIEAALRVHPSVHEAVAVVREYAPGDRRIVAYVVSDEGSVAGLRAHLAERVPEHMLPSAFVALDALPLTPSGKVDRRALPAPGGAGAEAFVAPRTPAERTLAGIWAEVLGAGRVGAADDFFELGGHSLLATQVVTRVREAFGVELPLRAVFEAPTVAALAARIGGAGGVDAADGEPPLVPVPRGGPLPLSFAQQRLWFIDRLEPGSSAYNMSFALRLRGALDPAVLRAALGELTRRHETLRTTFAERGGETVQVIHAPAPPVLPVVDLRGRPDGEAEAARRVREEAMRPFDLARGPLLRSTLLRLGGEEHVLCFALHHVVGDGWSMGVLVREVSALYDALARGEEARLPELPVQYADFAVWQRAWLSGETLEAHLGFWREKLAGAPALLELPVDRPRPPVQDGRAEVLRFELPPELSEAVSALSRAEGTTPFMTLLAGLQLLLARWSGQDDVAVGSPIAGRTRLETEGLIGFFANTLVLRTDLAGDPTVRGLLGRVRETTLGAYQHQEIPFERLVEEVAPERSLAHTPLFQVLFVFQNTDLPALRFGGVEAEPIGTDEEAAKFDLVFGLRPGDTLAGSLSYRTALWERATVERMLEHFRRVLAGMAADPGGRVSDVELLGAEEREQVLRGWNATEAAYPVEGGLAALFEAQAARTPDAPAVVSGGRSLTYADLDRESGRLADRLRALGAGPDARVGLFAGRSPEAAVGVLATIRAGAAYVPLDPAYPAGRLEHMLADAGCSILLTTEELRDRIPGFGGEVVLVGEAPTPDPSPAGRGGENGVFPDSLAYVVYTSGSTGRPKGVAMPQRPLLNLIAWQTRSWNGPRAARTLHFAPLGFDVSFQEMFSTWASGGTLVIVAEETRADPAALARTIEAEGIERVFLPFVALQHLAEAALERGIAPASLREVVTAGEQLRVTEPIRRWLGAIPGCVLVNQYGPSETHVVTALALAGAPGEWPALPPIGRPVAGTRLYVRDPHGRPAPVGVPGELYVGGDSLARGYLGRAELTAERFVPDPFGGEPGARLYRTGDRVRWLASGEVEFLGRTDQQVKVRGFRIEPGEIEAALERHPAVREALVHAREDARGDRRLVGYVVPERGTEAPAAAELRAFLAGTLPEYMVPGAFVALETLPLTASGKIDRRRLPAPGASVAGEEYVAPRTPTEAVLAGIYADVLRVERVGAEQGFFELGGHSLLATQVVSRIREALGVELPVRTLFDTATVAALARRVDEARRAGEGSSGPALAPIPRDASRRWKR